MQCSGPGPLGVLRMRYRSNAPSAPWSRNALRNGFYVTNAVQSARLSIRRVSEHHMVLADVCYPQDPTRSTFYGCDTEVTLPGAPGSPDPETLRVTIFSLVTRYAMRICRSGGCMKTAWYQLRYVMVRVWSDRRYSNAVPIYTHLAPGIVPNPDPNRCEWVPLGKCAERLGPKSEWPNSEEFLSFTPG